MPTAAEMHAKYLEAELAVLAGKDVSFGDPPRRLGMEDLDQIRAGRQEWERKVASEAARASGVPTIGGLGYSVASFRGQ
jgi:hypothetical protein